MNYQVTPLFSTPLVSANIGKLDPITLAWLKSLKFPISSVAEYPGEEHLEKTERGFDLLNQPKLQNLQNSIKQVVDYFVYTVLDVDDNVEFELTTSWLNKMDIGTDIALHNHANAVVSGVYYPEINETANPIIFKKNRQHLNSFPEHVRPNTKGNWNQYSIGELTVQPCPGDVLIFPSHLEHQVNMSHDTYSRYSLAFNYFPKGDLGSNSVKITL
jgi:uncharacterized protein (TIGR02466 family)